MASVAQHAAVSAARYALDEDRGAAQELDESQLLVGDDLIYLPCGFIGRVGSFYVPSSATLLNLSSGPDLGDHLWAHFRGMDFGRRGSSNSLAILSVHDERETLRVLKRFLKARYVNNEVKPQLVDLPAIIELVDLYNCMRALREAERNDWFTFEIRRAK